MAIRPLTLAHMWSGMHAVVMEHSLFHYNPHCLVMVVCMSEPIFVQRSTLSITEIKTYHAVAADVYCTGWP